jgi:hypothetical protein
MKSIWQPLMSILTAPEDRSKGSPVTLSQTLSPQMFVSRLQASLDLVAAIVTLSFSFFFLLGHSFFQCPSS